MEPTNGVLSLLSVFFCYQKKAFRRFVSSSRNKKSFLPRRQFAGIYPLPPPQTDCHQLLKCLPVILVDSLLERNYAPSIQRLSRNNSAAPSAAIYDTPPTTPLFLPSNRHSKVECN
ncbi:hypothetical protein LSTR_LSTR016844 [Laodelphax striatellus]|uniref:Uncharacterized protein n=1 Tax=Laodelphax striatellus TaxID=195883 RepID=A0A482X4G9_LAOST|nr:hypothetical protein LSTR_LSTR004107 [Laodelphax striatellus]RZF40300.1 hypothetical protein LSTR_LSTR016844 [Laodelphax striatellus]